MWNKKNGGQRLFSKVRTRYIQSFDQKIEFLMNLMELRLGFLVADLSQRFGIYLVAFALKFFIH